MKDRAKNSKYDWNRGKMIIQWFSKKNSRRNKHVEKL
jgi:hypothetical protein